MIKKYKLLEKFTWLIATIILILLVVITAMIISIIIIYTHTIIAIIGGQVVIFIYKSIIGSMLWSPIDKPTLDLSIASLIFILIFSIIEFRFFKAIIKVLREKHENNRRIRQVQKKD